VKPAAAAFAAIALFAASSQVQAQERIAGTSAALPESSAARELSLGYIYPANVYSRAQYGTGGVGLRNRGGGALNVSGVNKPTKAAFVYWAVITNGAAPPPVKSVKIQRITPAPSAVATITGTAIGITASPCWAGNTTTVYRGTVPLAIANGNGTYQITLNAGASGSTAGGDPWYTAQTLPLMEGASLVVVGTGQANVALYDRGLAGNMFSTTLSYTLALPSAATGRNVIIDNIGADGQVGSSRNGLTSSSNESTIINGYYVAGEYSPANDSDWNGAIAGPLPQLWDNTGHQINASAPAGTWYLNTTVYAGGDCLVPVANVVALY